MTTTLSYVYCILHAGKARPSPPSRAPRGLAGMSKPRVIDAGGGLSLVVADAPAEAYGAKAIERGLRDLDWVSRAAAAHEAVVESFAHAGTVVPMKLFTLFASEARALAHIASMKNALAKVVARIEGREEWGVRVRFDEAKARLADARSSSWPGVAKRAAAASGKNFLLMKKSQQDSARLLLARAHDRVGAIFDELTALSSEARELPVAPGPSGTRLLMDAVFLVPARAVVRFRSATDKLAGKLAGEGFAIALTGPWPPYNFIAAPNARGSRGEAEP